MPDELLEVRENKLEGRFISCHNMLYGVNELT